MAFITRRSRTATSHVSLGRRQNLGRILFLGLNILIAPRPRMLDSLTVSLPRWPYSREITAAIQPARLPVRRLALNGHILSNNARHRLLPDLAVLLGPRRHFRLTQLLSESLFSLLKLSCGLNSLCLRHIPLSLAVSLVENILQFWLGRRPASIARRALVLPWTSCTNPEILSSTLHWLACDECHLLVASREYCALFFAIQCIDELIHHPLSRLIGVPSIQPHLWLTFLLSELSAKLGLFLTG